MQFGQGFQLRPDNKNAGSTEQAFCVSESLIDFDLSRTPYPYKGFTKDLANSTVVCIATGNANQTAIGGLNYCDYMVCLTLQCMPSSPDPKLFCVSFY